MFWQLLPIGIFFLSFFLLVGSLFLWRWIDQRRNRRRSPLTRGLLRGPGESLREQIDDATLDLFAYLTVVPAMPLMMYSVYATEGAHGAKPGVVAIAIGGVASVVALAYGAYKVTKQARLRRQLMLGMDAEIAVGQELNRLMLLGYHVFHDVPAEKFNVDHVVVGPGGIFAVETKGRSKRLSKDARAEARLIYDGKILRFPNHDESAPLKQAVAQARWLRDWLSSAVGECVSVRPVLAIPGWYIELKKKEAGSVYVFNGKLPDQLLPKNREPLLGDQLILRIAHQLDQRCRDVEPKAYAQPKAARAA